MACTECKENMDIPHICKDAQYLGEGANCCDNGNCFSIRAIGEEAMKQWGEDPPEPYLQALINSRNLNITS